MRKREVIDVLDVQRRLCDRARAALAEAGSCLDAMLHIPFEMSGRDESARHRSLVQAIADCKRAYEYGRHEARQISNAMSALLVVEDTQKEGGKEGGDEG